jgi:hypothetical protein
MADLLEEPARQSASGHIGMIRLAIKTPQSIALKMINKDDILVFNFTAEGNDSILIYMIIFVY